MGKYSFKGQSDIFYHNKYFFLSVFGGVAPCLRAAALKNPALRAAALKNPALRATALKNPALRATALKNPVWGRCPQAPTSL